MKTPKTHPTFGRRYILAPKGESIATEEEIRASSMRTENILLKGGRMRTPLPQGSKQAVNGGGGKQLLVLILLMVRKETFE